MKLFKVIYQDEKGLTQEWYTSQPDYKTLAFEFECKFNLPVKNIEVIIPTATRG
jgi:hypothetical protein